MKEQLINDILMALQVYFNREQLQILERVLLAQMYTVEITRMETGLSTELDDNDYMLDTIKFNMQKRDLSPRTVEQYIRAARALVDTTHKNLRRIEPVDVEYYLSVYAEGRGGRPNSNHTVNNERKFVSAVFVWLRRCNFIDRNPVENVLPRKIVKKPIDFLCGVEVEELRAACEQNTAKGKRERAILEFLLSTGCRVGEVPGIKTGDVDFVSGRILVYGRKDREYREVYLSDAARVHIRRYLDTRTDDSPYLFVSSRGGHDALHEAAYRSILKDIKERASMSRRVYPHLMRKTMASTLRQHGASVNDIADLLGHADSRVTTTYYAAASQDGLHRVHSMCTG